jgi:hypothetical protein
MKIGCERATANRNALGSRHDQRIFTSATAIAGAAPGNTFGVRHGVGPHAAHGGSLEAVSRHVSESMGFPRIVPGDGDCGSGARQEIFLRFFVFPPITPL